MFGVVAATAPTLLAFNVAPSATFFNQAMALAAWGWFVLGVAPSGRGAWLVAKPVAMALALLMTSVLVSSIWGSLPWSLAASALGLLAAAATLLVSGAAARPAHEALGAFESFCVGFAVAGVVNALLAVVQVFAPGWPDGDWLAASGIPGRAVGNLRQPNHLSSLLTWSAVAVVALMALGRLPWRWAAACGSLILLGVVLSASRTGTLSVLILALWGLVDRRLPRSARALLVLAPVVYGLAWGGMAWWAQSSAQVFGGSARLGEHDVSGSRFGIWSNTWALIRMHPWWGVGFGEFNFAWSLTPFPSRPVAFFDHTHNLLLQFAVELGLPMAAALGALLLWGLWRAGRNSWSNGWREEGPHEESMGTDIGVAQRSAFVMVLLMALHSQLEYPLWYAYFLLPCAWAWGFALAQPLKSAQGSPPSQSQPSQPSEPSRPSSPSAPTPWSPPMALAAGSLIIAAALSVADYRRVAEIFVAYDGAPSLAQRIQAGQRSVFFAHHAHYAAATVTDMPAQAMDSFDRATHFLLDTRLMVAWARAWHDLGDEDRALHLAQRLREFHNPASEEFFQPCAQGASEPAPAFPCAPPSRELTWTDFVRRAPSPAGEGHKR